MKKKLLIVVFSILLSVLSAFSGGCTFIRDFVDDLFDEKEEINIPLIDYKYVVKLENTSDGYYIRVKGQIREEFIPNALYLEFFNKEYSVNILSVKYEANYYVLAFDDIIVPSGYVFYGNRTAKLVDSNGVEFESKTVFIPFDMVKCEGHLYMGNPDNFCSDIESEWEYSEDEGGSAGGSAGGSSSGTSGDYLHGGRYWTMELGD